MRVEEHRGAVGGKEDGSWPVYSVAGVLSVEAGCSIMKSSLCGELYTYFLLQCGDCLKLLTLLLRVFNCLAKYPNEARLS